MATLESRTERGGSGIADLSRRGMVPSTRQILLYCFAAVKRSIALQHHALFL